MKMKTREKENYKQFIFIYVVTSFTLALLFSVALRSTKNSD